MKRQHGIEEYRFLVKKLREDIPNFTLSTDIIVGFPTESDEDFHQTMDLLRESRPSVCNRTRYVPRAKTPAFSLAELPKEVKKERSKKLTDLFKDISKELLHKTCKLFHSHPYIVFFLSFLYV